MVHSTMMDYFNAASRTEYRCHTIHGVHCGMPCYHFLDLIPVKQRLLLVHTVNMRWWPLGVTQRLRFTLGRTFYYCKRRLINMNIRCTTFLGPSQIRSSKPDMRQTELLATRHAACIYANMVYQTLIESKMYYATFLCQSCADALHAFDCLLQRFFQCCLGIGERHFQIPRLLPMFNIDTLGIRRGTLANAFVGRFIGILDEDHATEWQKLHAKTAQTDLNTS